MKAVIKQILFFLLFLSSCQEAAKNFFEDPLVLNDGSQNTILRRPKVTGVKFQAGAIVLSGERLDRITSLKIQNKSLVMSKKSEDEVWAVAKGTIDLVLNEVVSLVVDSAYGQSIIPIDVQLNAGSIKSLHIANGSILEEDLADGAVGYSKITDSGTQEGSYLYFSEGSWKPHKTSPEGSSSIGVQKLSLGAGMVGKDTSIFNTGNIAVNTGHRENQILILDNDDDNYYGKLSHKGPVVIDSSDPAHKTHSYIKFDDGVNNHNFVIQQVSSDSLDINFNTSDDLMKFSKEEVSIHRKFKITNGIVAETGEHKNFTFSGDSEISEFKVEQMKEVNLSAGDAGISISGTSEADVSIVLTGKTNFTDDVTINSATVSTDGGDYAEYFRSEHEMSPGDIVGLNINNGLVRKYTTGDHLMGVITTSPAVLGNSNETGEFIAPVALIGQVPFLKDQVKVINRVVFTKDNKRIGYLLNNGLVFLRIN